ncbi:MAG TPA: glycosyltransferase family 2 protein [Candidatus Nanopelagicales bacterium]|jgi:GT2 family glycosyltransferase
MPHQSTLDELRVLEAHMAAITEGLTPGEDEVVSMVSPSEDTTPAPVPAAPYAELAADLEGLTPRPHRVDHITAVLVCHDGARWLPAVLTSLAGSARQPHVVVAVDVGSQDGTGRLLGEALREGVVDHVVVAERTSSFAASVASGLAATAPVGEAWGTQSQWLWFLHDDSAPAVDALEELLHAGDHQPSIAVVGPKVRGWHDRRLLLECGVTVGRSGARVTGLERGEHDQGQRDGVIDVLAVGSAGMLVRRDAWDRLAGFDPAYPIFRDDVDLCWRANLAGYRVVVSGAAVVNHRQAAANGRRPAVAALPGGPAGHGSPRRRDRASALHLMLAHATRPALLFVALRLLLGSALRSLGLLLGKSPQEARDEMSAVLDTLAHPGALRASRALVRKARAGPGSLRPREVRRLLAPRAGQARQGIERFAALVLAGGGSEGSRSALDADGGDDVDPWSQTAGQSRLRRWLRRPGVLLVLGLLLATIVAVRDLVGDGVLMGGALVAAPPGAGDLVQAYLSGWHDVGLGSAAQAPPWLLLLALPAALLRGQAPLAVDVLLLLAVPMAGLSAYAALRGLIRSPWVRSWAALSYALLPALTVGIGSGRLGTSVAAILLPPLARSGARLVGAGRPATWRRACGTGLLLAVVAAFVPVVWLVALVIGVVGILLVRGLAGRLKVLVAVAAPALLLGPWLTRAIHNPGLLLLEPGFIGPVDPKLDGIDVLLLHPGGPGSEPLWWLLPLLLAALVALLIRDRWRVTLPAWLVAVTALGFAVLQLASRVQVDGVAEPVRPWPGPATLIAGGALIVAAATAGEGLRARVTGRSFGWRQPGLVLLTAATLIAPFGALAVWITGVQGPLHRADPQVVPAFVAVDLGTPDRPRALLLRVTGQQVQYELLNSPAPTLGERDVAEAPGAQVAQAVGSLVAGVGGDEVEVLADWSVKYVVLQGVASHDAALARVLDSEGGLRRVAGTAASALWRVATPAPRVQLVPDAGPAPASTPATTAATTSLPFPVNPGTGDTVAAAVPAGAAPGQLVLAQSAAPGWTARTSDGQVLAAAVTTTGTVGRWQAAVPSGASGVVLSYEDPGRTRALWLQAIAALVFVVLALPARRRPVPDDDEDEPDPAPLQVPVVEGPAQLKELV